MQNIYICNMRQEVNINADMITWAIARAGYDLYDFTHKVPSVLAWIQGDKRPTVKQLEEFSKKVYLPFGYLFLPEPPKEHLPIPFFRTDNTYSTNVSINVYDTILLLKQRQDWLADYLKECDFSSLPFVGKFENNSNVDEIVADIRNTLGLSYNWAGCFKTWQEALDELIIYVENAGIITAFNGVVDNNTHRSLEVTDCRGFVLVDKIAPLIFVNNADSKAAQMFTIVHELAHIWIGHSAAFDFRKLEPADNEKEKLCDKIAAEFLVPKVLFNDVWQKESDIKKLARYFKVSEIVIARRALDFDKISRSRFFEFYDDYITREFVKKETKNSGGDFYATTRKRLGLAFSTHINNAVKSGKLLYRDAYKLTSLKGDTFHTYFTKHF